MGKGKKHKENHIYFKKCWLKQSVTVMDKVIKLRISQCNTSVTGFMLSIRSLSTYSWIIKSNKKLVTKDHLNKVFYTNYSFSLTWVAQINLKRIKVKNFHISLLNSQFHLNNKDLFLFFRTSLYYLTFFFSFLFVS